jgi:hypothetical protein
LTPNELILMKGRQLLRQDAFHTGEVHAMDTSNVPQYATRELLNVSMHFDLPSDPQVWAQLVGPNIDWAEEHFSERVSGEPMNPAPSHVRWPYAQANNARHTQDGVFSHTYPERFWPKFAGLDASMFRPEHRKAVLNEGRHRGIRYAYGDLGDVVDLMDRSLYTRQAFLPVWFPEDTGAVEKQRVPCTIGYHFIVRPSGLDDAPDRLHVTYFMRSCDYVRYLRDDIYMAGRLAQWVCDALVVRGHDVFADSLTLHITSLHSFVGDDWLIKRQVGNHTITGRTA